MSWPRARISASTISMPFLSIVRSPFVVTRILIQRFSLSTQKRRFCRLGRKRRFVLLFACDTWLPPMGFLPVTAQTRDIELLRKRRRKLYPDWRRRPTTQTTPSQQPALGERHCTAAADDEMIEHLDVDH